MLKLGVCPAYRRWTRGVRYIAKTIFQNIDIDIDIAEKIFKNIDINIAKKILKKINIDIAKKVSENINIA